MPLANRRRNIESGLKCLSSLKRRAVYQGIFKNDTLSRQDGSSHTDGDNDWAFVNLFGNKICMFQDFILSGLSY